MYNIRLLQGTDEKTSFPTRCGRRKLDNGRHF